MRTFITAVAVALVLPASALAIPSNDEIRALSPHSSLAVQPAPSSAGLDLRAPDQSDPMTGPSRLFAPGTDVAAPDQQAPIPAVGHRAVHHAAPVGNGFDWGAAAIGAAGIVAMLSIVAGLGVLGVNRRRGSRRIASTS
jgi:hypothetical protein